MKAILSTILILIFSITIIYAQKNPKVLTYGKIIKNTYYNDFYGMSLSFNTNWYVKSREELNILENNGKKIIQSRNKNMEEIIDFSLKKTAFLFGVNEYQQGIMVDFNPSFLLITESIKGSSVHSAEDYLNNTKSILKKSNSKYVFDESMETVNTFKVMKLKVESGDIHIQQWYLSKIMGENVLSCVITFNNEEQKKQLNAIISSIKFQ